MAAMGDAHRVVGAGGRVFASRQPDDDPIVRLHFTFWFRSVIADLGVSVLVGAIYLPTSSSKALARRIVCFTCSQEVNAREINALLDRVTQQGTHLIPETLTASLRVSSHLVSPFCLLSERTSARFRIHSDT